MFGRFFWLLLLELKFWVACFVIVICFLLISTCVFDGVCYLDSSAPQIIAFVEDDMRLLGMAKLLCWSDRHWLSCCAGLLYMLLW